MPKTPSILRESDNLGLQVAWESSTGEEGDRPLFKRKSRTRQMDLAPGSVGPTALGRIIQQTAIVIADFVSVPDNKGSNLEATLTTNTGSLFLPQFFIAPYVNQIAPSNRYIGGSFFSAATPIQTAANYDLGSYYDAENSTDTKVIFRARLTNHTGSTVNIAWKVKVRVIVNGAGVGGQS